MACKVQMGCQSWSYLDGRARAIRITSLNFFGTQTKQTPRIHCAGKSVRCACFAEFFYTRAVYSWLIYYGGAAAICVVAAVLSKGHYSEEKIRNVLYI